MLSPVDLLVIAVTALVCTSAATAAALAFLYLNRRGTIGSHMAAVTGATVAAIVGSTVAISAEMYLSPHDLRVLLWVIGMSAVMGSFGAWFMLHRVRRSFLQLRRAAERIGAGEIVQADLDGAAEFSEISVELADASARLVASRSEIARLDAARRQLVAWVSHDLRSPLAGIRAMAEALEEGVAQAPAEYIRLIRDQVDAVNRMVDELFELSKIQSGALKLTKEPVVLLDLISDVVSDMRARALERGIRVRQSGMTDHMLLADPRELSRVIANLLANSIRYAPENSEILISADRVDSGRIVLSVLDQGPGVHTKDIGNMFEMGWRGSAARAEDEGGSGAGIGLAIVRGIVEAHGGEVSAAKVTDGFRLDVILPTAEEDLSGK
ncbi:sensor histidine kinase [Mycobacteroides abscessus]|uniref:sensor histidine kinase n=2 Tax=Mycobacteroides abscessus TaxID=36809 RepID=UPI0009D10565|nr:HAMP domain-containing sensor histidine kinase [Mycobacteroides abscessus]SKG09969.1 integral membrane sensor signal transduction histidine kinase [Mycobacteroides abscessus subsp. massiliense]SKG96109.1 integral membrane sensor signal transduction histidine kinase [Mycobacteroides abscessus subsp. massiliense]SKH76538.1 integral membrane sensor signal transduction histidine kinase [Mycobacteroides abscessus subsp. massiliense]SKI58090.1 integral membrane sensor signal transduction histidine